MRSDQPLGAHLVEEKQQRIVDEGSRTPGPLPVRYPRRASDGADSRRSSGRHSSHPADSRSASASSAVRSTAPPALARSKSSSARSRLSGGILTASWRRSFWPFLLGVVALVVAPGGVGSSICAAASTAGSAGTPNADDPQNCQTRFRHRGWILEFGIGAAVKKLSQAVY